MLSKTTDSRKDSRLLRIVKLELKVKLQLELDLQLEPNVKIEPKVNMNVKPELKAKLERIRDRQSPNGSCTELVMDCRERRAGRYHWSGAMSGRKLRTA